MEPLNVSKLSTQEVVERFFTEINVGRYAYDFVKRPDAPDEIRKYIAKHGIDIKRILFAKFAQLSDFAENDAVCELMDAALCAWTASFLQDGEVFRFAPSFPVYLSEIAHYVSGEHKRRYGSFDEKRGDWMLVERIRGAQHLRFLANHLNEHFNDPICIDQWNLVFTHCFKQRSTPADAPIAALFCRYMLESENDDPQIPFYSEECGTAFKLSLPVIRFISVNGLTVIRHDLWESNLYGQADFASTLYNIIKAIWRYRLYEDFSEGECERFKDALALYPCFGMWSSMKEFLKDGVAGFVRLAISAWSGLFERKAQGVAANQARGELGWTIAGRCLGEQLPRIREFLLSIPSSEVGGCPREWENMQRNMIAYEYLP